MQEQIKGLYSLFLTRLKQVDSKNSKSGIISFPNLFEKLCRNFSISKKECWIILGLLKNAGLIEIVAFHGVRVKGGGEIVEVVG